jgi:hypothetical protein
MRTSRQTNARGCPFGLALALALLLQPGSARADVNLNHVGRLSVIGATSAGFYQLANGVTVRFREDCAIAGGAAWAVFAGVSVPFFIAGAKQQHVVSCVPRVTFASAPRGDSAALIGTF